jgi:hypothetical protein
MSDSYGKILAGQILLIVCCVIYIVWWSVSYRPGETVNRIGGFRGILLLCTAAAGLTGTALSIFGINDLPKGGAHISNALICAAGIAAYVVLLLITRFGFGRPVTTELVLITGWAVLELCVVNAANGTGFLPDSRFIAMILVIAAAVVISLVLYILYYRMDEWKAYYFAAVPLVTEAVCMAIINVAVKMH